MKYQLALASLALALALPGHGQSKSLMVKPDPAPSYQRIVENVANMLANTQVARMVGAKRLDLVNVMWEDTGRYLGSSVGPNISDVTIEVETEGAGGRRNYLMPVIRYPNFTDKTADIKLDKFFVRVGNHEKEGRLRTVSLRELLAHPTRYMSLPRSGTIKGGSLLAKRDSHVLVSAQSAFLPVPRGDKATFYPVIFNYQSYAGNPAVLTILVTRQGTSMTIVDNSRDTVSGGASWGQRLYFNAAGERAPLTAERLTDVKQKGVTQNGESAASLGKDSNLLMLIQVPLKVKEIARYGDFDDGMIALPDMADGAPMAAPSRAGSGLRRADMDTAVLGHGATQGPYAELEGLTIERDERFPIRVTVQFYQATSTGVINQHHVNALAAQIDKVYARGDYVGSLVVPENAQRRPTEYTGTSVAPAGLSWLDFPGLVERYERYGRLGHRLGNGVVNTVSPVTGALGW